MSDTVVPLSPDAELVPVQRSLLAPVPEMGPDRVSVRAEPPTPPRHLEDLWPECVEPPVKFFLAGEWLDGAWTTSYGSRSVEDVWHSDEDVEP